MAQWIEVKVRYEKLTETGKSVKVTDPYLVDALSCTEAEARVVEEITPFCNDFNVLNVGKTKISEIFWSEGGDKFYKVKVNFITIDEKTAAEKGVPLISSCKPPTLLKLSPTSTKVCEEHWPTMRLRVSTKQRLLMSTSTKSRRRHRTPLRKWPKRWPLTKVCNALQGISAMRCRMVQRYQCRFTVPTARLSRKQSLSINPNQRTMTIDEFKALRVAPVTKKRNKYGAKKSGGYDSKKEHSRANELKLMQRAGLISNLREQVKYVLIPAQRDTAGNLLERECAYYADFVYSKDGKTVVEDTKGVRTKEYKIKRKLMLHVHGISIVEI